MRFLFIVIGSTFITVLALLLTRFWGQSQTYSTYENKFYQTLPDPFYVARGNSPEQIRIASMLGPSIVLWLDVHITQDQKLLTISDSRVQQILNKEKLGPEKYLGMGTTKYSYDFIHKQIPDSTLLVDILSGNPNRKFIINIIDNVDSIHSLIVDTLRKFNLEENILIQSDTHVLISSVKELNPLWLFGTSHADIMRLLSFESLFILPAAPFKGDVFITPLSLLGRNVLNSSVLDEIKHRRKKIIIGPISNEIEFKKAKEVSPNGYFLENPEISKNWLNL